MELEVAAHRHCRNRDDRPVQHLLGDGKLFSRSMSPTASADEITASLIEHKIWVASASRGVLLAIVVAFPGPLSAIRSLHRLRRRPVAHGLHRHRRPRPLFVPGFIFAFIILQRPPHSGPNRGLPTTLALDDFVWLWVLWIGGTIIVQNLTLACSRGIRRHHQPTFPCWYGDRPG